MKNWKKYAFEFISIFVAVVAAFALDKWNSDRKDAVAEEKILREIINGLEQDKGDLKLNIQGHNVGIRACAYWRAAVLGDTVPVDSLMFMMQSLARDFISIQNPTGYQSLRSRGLELVKDDSLRSDIINLYEYDLAVLRKLEEDYGEMQFHARYQPTFHEVIAPSLRYGPQGWPVDLARPVVLTEADRQRMLLLLYKIESDRKFILHFYDRIEERVNEVVAHIERVLADR